MSERFQTATAPTRPEFEIKVAQSALEAEVMGDVLEVDVDERVNCHAVAQIMLRNWDQGERHPLYSDAELFALGADLTISAGYLGELDEVFDGVITAITAHFPANSTAVAIIEARSRSALMVNSKRGRVFEEQTLEDRFQQIAQDYGLDADVGASDTVESHFDYETDWDRILATAERFGWVAYVRNKELILGDPSKPAEPVELVYGTNLLELRLNEDLRHRSDPVNAIMWDHKELAVIESEADSTAAGVSTGDRPDLSSVLADSGLPLRSGFTTSPQQGTQAEADARSAGAARTEQLRYQTGVGVAVGLPPLRINQWLKIGGTGSRTDGEHYVTRVRHRIGRNGYTTEFTLGHPAILAPRANTTTTDHPQVLIGTVTDIEDPQNIGRVKVTFKWADPALNAVWARLATLDAGPEYGTTFIPNPGTEVVVAFAGDDPIVLGQIWSGANPPPVAMADGNPTRAITSPGGHQLTLVDGDEAKVSVTTAGGHELLLDDAAGSITVTETSGNSIAVDSSGITLTAASGDIVLAASAGKVKIDAVGIEGNATGPSKIASSATLDISASATLGLKGSLVNIN